MPCFCSIFSHHCEKFLVVHLAVSILINSRQHYIDFFFCHCKVVALQTHAQFLATDRSAAIFIEISKRGLEVVLFEVVGTLQTSSNKLSVVDKSILVAVNDFHSSLNVLQVDLDFGTVLESVDEFFDCQLAVAIYIYLCENLAQKNNLVFWNSTCNQTQSSSLKLDRIHVVFHVVVNIFAHLYLTIFLLFLLLYPGMVVRLLGSQSHVSLSVQELRDKIFCFFGDICPHWVVEAVVALQHIVNNFLVTPAAKWRFATQHNEHDDSHRPVVTL